MKLLPIEPTSNIGCSSLLTDETLVIPQYVRDWNKLNKYDTVFIDNGVFEIYHTNEINPRNKETYIVRLFKQINKKRKTLKCKTYIVLPDIPFDFYRTLTLNLKILKTTKNKTKNLIGVIQGKKLYEIELLANFYWYNNIPIIAIPIKLREHYRKTANINITEFIYKHSPYKLKQIHQLGFCIDDIFDKWYWKTRSFDTTYPFKILMLNLPIGMDAPRPTNYFKQKLDCGKMCTSLIDFKNFLKHHNIKIKLNGG